jgi:hypothetical protein
VAACGCWCSPQGLAQLADSCREICWRAVTDVQIALGTRISKIYCFREVVCILSLKGLLVKHCLPLSCSFVLSYRSPLKLELTMVRTFNHNTLSSPATPEGSGRKAQVWPYIHGVVSYSVPTTSRLIHNIK